MPDIIGIDHIYIAVTDLARAEEFYDRVFLNLNFRKNKFTLDGDAHIQYFNRMFGYVLRPSRTPRNHDPYAPGLHHFCLRVDTGDDVRAAWIALRDAGIEVTEPKIYPEYAADYAAIFFCDPDGLRLEITNYRAERRQRHDHWND